MIGPFIQVALDLSASLGAEDRYQRLVKAVFDTLPTDGVLLTHLGDDGMLRPLATEGIQQRIMEMTFPLENRAVAGDTQTHKPYRKIGNVGLLTCYEGVPDDEQRQGILIGVPLMVEDTMVGSLNLAAQDVHAFDALDDESIQLYAALASAAMRTAQLLDKLQGALELREQVTRELLRYANKRTEGPLLGNSEAVRTLRQQAGNWALKDDAVLLMGPPGSPKETVARAIHAAGRRNTHAFIHVQCALMAGHDPQDILGHGFRLTGELEDARRGKLDLATGGTLFLDGIEHLPEQTLLALARLIERYRFLRSVQRPVVPDTRLLLSTGFELTKHELRERFPERLAAALEMNVLKVPALTERREDIPRLAEHFIRRHALRLGSPINELTQDSVERLVEYDWPGDMQELDNVLGRAVIAARGGTIEVDDSLLRGGISLGGYTLTERIAEGGMGEVWLARHKLLARQAAVKVIRPEMLSGGAVRDNIDRFMREARATANLRSVHTVEIYDFGISDDGSFYYVMEQLHGFDLETLVQHFGPMPPERVIPLLQQACRSLSEAHEAGLVHRDIKPANLVACHFGHDYDVLKVLDFGMVATATSPDGGEAVQGTPGYIAPEAAQRGMAVDLRCDLYGLGCVAYWMLTGFPVFERDNALQLLMAHMHVQPEAPSSRLDHPLPSGLDELVLACLEKDPARRPSDAETLHQMLGAIRPEETWTQSRARAWWTTHHAEYDRMQSGLVPANDGRGWMELFG